MCKNNDYYIELDTKIENLLRGAEFLDSGHNGIVYLLPDKRIIKIFKDKKVCLNEYAILNRTKNSKYFPKVSNHGPYYIVREYVEGQRLDKYIKEKGFNKKIAHNIIILIQEFKRLHFEKLDIRCKDLYLSKDLSLTVIDPKKNYSKKMIYPRHLMKGLNNLGVLEEFLSTVKDENLEIYKLWNFRIKQYLEQGIK